MAYRYILEPYKGMASRYTCPACRKPKTFTRYIDTQTGSHVADIVGKCSREVSCAYHYTPRQNHENNKPLFEPYNPPIWKHKPNFSKPKPKQFPPVSGVPLEPFKESLQPNRANCLVTYLITLFGAEMAAQVVSRYFIGSANHWNGATVFWQIDGVGKIRAGKIMLYNPENGKRVKEPYSHITWVHKSLKLPEFEIKQCLFGEHLLKADRNKPCALVESEKTAIIASVYLPHFIWLAVGSLTNLNADKCQVLKGRSVTLFPDLNGFAKWQAKANELSHLARFTVSDLLEKKGTDAEKVKGLDLADYLIHFKYSQFVTQEPKLNPYETKPALIEPIKIQTADISAMLGQTQTGNDFGRLIIVGIKTKAGNIYDLLFDAEGEPIQPGTEPETVSKSAAFFGKKFQPAMLNNTPCLLHIYK